VVSKPLADAMSPPWQVPVRCPRSACLPVVALLGTSRRLRCGTNLRRAFWEAFVAGVCGCAGNIACYQGPRRAGGKAAAVMPLTSLYPAGDNPPGYGNPQGTARRHPVVGASQLHSCPALFRRPGLLVVLSLAGCGPRADFSCGASAASCRNRATSCASSEWVTMSFPAWLRSRGQWQRRCLYPSSGIFPAATWVWLILLGLFYGSGQSLTLIIAYGADGPGPQ